MSSKAGFLASDHSSFSTDKFVLLGAYQIGIFPVAQTDRYYILRARLNFNWLFIGKKQWNGWPPPLEKVF